MGAYAARGLEGTYWHTHQTHLPNQGADETYKKLRDFADFALSL